MRQWLGLTSAFACSLAVAGTIGVGTASARAAGPPAPCVTPPPGMVAWYPFDETTGTTAAETVFGNNGTEIGGPTHIPGKIDYALQFDGVNDYVESPNAPQINFGQLGATADFSIDTWIKLPATLTNSVTTILDKRDPGTTFGYSFYLSFKRLGIQLSGPATPGANYTSTPIPTITTGSLWRHVAVTVHPGGNAVFYYNGAAWGAPVPTTGPGSMLNTSPLRIGTRTAASPLTGWLPGALDELEIFNRVLTPAEVGGLAVAFPPNSSGKCKHVIKPQSKKIKAFEGAPFSAQVLTFTDSIMPPSPPGAYSATINWGDATPSSAGTVTGGPTFAVTGSHTYAEEGTYTVTVTVTVGFVSVTATSTAIVKDVPIQVACALPSGSSMNFSGPVATFSHVNPLEPNGNAEFQTTVSWGDGSPNDTTPTPNLTVSGFPGPSYAVAGVHNYLTTGWVAVTVTVKDDTEVDSKTCKIKIKAKTSPPMSVLSANHDVWLAGMPPGTTDNFVGDVAPAQSPFQAGPPATIIPGQYLEFTGVSGTPGFDAGGTVPHTSSCDGSTFFPNFTHSGGPANGMSTLTAPANALIGVFIGPGPPAPPPYAGSPPALDFSDATGAIPSGVPVGGGPIQLGAASRTFSTLSPALRQVFFIGDGLTGTGGGLQQQFFIPAGATRLFLGTMDQQNWKDNVGQCDIKAILTSDP